MSWKWSGVVLEVVEHIQRTNFIPKPSRWYFETPIFTSLLWCDYGTEDNFLNCPLNVIVTPNKRHLHIILER